MNIFPVSQPGKFSISKSVGLSAFLHSDGKSILCLLIYGIMQTLAAAPNSPVKNPAAPLGPEDYFSGEAYVVDGIQYADFSRAGLEENGKRTQPLKRFTVNDFQGTDRERVQAAVDAAAEAGGGVVHLPAGEYRFDDFVYITADNTVVRGDGPERTKIIFTNSSENNHNHGALTFHGKGAANVYHKVVEPVEPGDRLLVLDKDYGYRPGDFVLLRVHQDHGIVPFGFYNHKYALYKQGNIDNYMHQTIVKVAAVDGRKLTLAQPLRVRFIGTPLEVRHGKLMTHVRPIRMIRDCAVEDLSIETEKFADRMYTSSVAFTAAYRCRVKNVHATRTGSLPVQFREAKNVEIRDCIFDRAWNTGGGGNGYLVFWTVYDGLMTNIKTRELRHAPNLQAWSNGCVIQGGMFHNNDVQWHTRWTCENLMEGITMRSGKDDDAYYGLFSTELYTTISGHEPHLHGNVFYGGDIELRRSGPRGAVLGGLYKDWVFAYNRIVNTNDKPVVELGDWCDGVIFKGNHFGMREFSGRPNEYGVDFKPGFNPDTKRYGDGPSHNRNVVFQDNTFYGLPKERLFRTRHHTPSVNRNSRAIPDAAAIPAPKPYVPSLFAYQKTLRKARPNVWIVNLLNGQSVTLGEPLKVKVNAPASDLYGTPERIELFFNGEKVAESDSPLEGLVFPPTPSGDSRFGRLQVRVAYGPVTFVDRVVLELVTAKP